MVTVLWVNSHLFKIRIRLECPPSNERFKLDLSTYIKEEEEPMVKKGDESDEEEAAEAMANWSNLLYI